MYNGFQSPIPPSDAELATQTLNEEAAIRFRSFSANDAVTLGLSLRKRFRASSRHARGKGMVLSIQTVSGQTLFACTVGDLGGPSGVGDVSLDSWAMLENLVGVVRRTGHSSYYVEKGMGAAGKPPIQIGSRGEFRVCGGAFPVWLENAPCCPIAIVTCYSGSGPEDHHLVAQALRDYIRKMEKDTAPPQSTLSMGMSMRSQTPQMPQEPRESNQTWMAEPASGGLYPPSEYRDEHGD